MGRNKIIITFTLVLFSLALYSQQKDSVKVKLNHYSFAVGTGWTHYINNLENGDDDIRQNFAGVSFKFFWEPEHRLSLGLESGYYKLFKTTHQVNTDTTLEVNRTVVPLLLLVRMRIVDNVYLGAGFGMALLNNKASGANQEITTKTTSLANFELTGAYIYPLSRPWQVGGEARVYRFGSLEDWMLSVQAMCAFRF